jgi:hypothetical protein
MPETSKWRRESERPREMRVTLIVDPVKHPELAAHLWKLPYGQVGPYIRDVLLEHFMQSGASPEDRLSAAVQSLQENERATAALVDRLSAAVGTLEQATRRPVDASPAPQVLAPPAQDGPDQSLSPAALRFAHTF